MFRFVPDTVGGVGSKRKHAPKSCESCKKRHKRCSHTTAPSTASTGTSDHSPSQTRVNGRAASANEAGTSEPAAQDATRTSPQETSPQADHRHQAALPPAPPGPRHPASQGAYLRFVGDLSPEASFLMNQHRQSGAQKQRAEIGVWLGQRPEDAPPSEDNDPAIRIEPTSSPAFRLDGLPGLKAIYPYLRKECMTVLPPDYEFSLISNLYFTKFDPIFPILHGEDFDHHDPLDAVALKQGICLVAAMDPSLRMHLRLPHTEAVLSQSEFRSHIATALKQALDAGFIRHQMVLLQVSTLMAFYVDKPSSSEISSHYTAQAVELSQTLGLHLGWPSNGVSTDKAGRIFWCIWTLDRLNAATNGRPIMIHRQDMDKRILESVDEQMPPFRLFIRISRLLDETISQYRPQSTTESGVTTDRSHTFERFVLEMGAEEVGSALLASLELFYLAVVILQSRPEQPDTDGGRVPSSNLQTFCALSVIAIASEEFKSSMTFWPVVPYAVSLAASAAYKSLRNSCLPYKRKQAYTVFYSSCDILDELSRSFISARAMAQLANDTLQEVERVSSHRNKSRPQHRESQTGQDQSGETASCSTTATEKNPPSAADESGDPAEPPATQAVVPIDPRGVTQAMPGPYDSSFFNGVDMGDVGGIFNDFDPNFHLHRVDAVFSANLNPTMPFFPEHWMGGPFDSYP